MILWLLACSGNTPQWCDTRGDTMGTTWTAKWSADDCSEPALLAGLEAGLASVDQQMSTWRDDSELSAVRRGPGRVTVSPVTASVTQDALALAAQTDGAFDPTVQPLMEVWGFHSRTRALTPPSEEALTEARSKVGHRRVETGPDWIDAHGTALDLSAIAKGHAVDVLSGVLAGAGHPDHMVEIGGEVRVSGKGPRGRWTLGVDVPEQGAVPGRQFAAILTLTDVAVATSGNYRNLVDVGGRRVHHTMDPRTGQPAQTDVASATVLAPTCREADALATAVMVLGTEKGLALLEGRPGVEGLILQSGATLTQRKTRGMQAHLAE